jgi:hypothetical protein
MDAQLLAVGFWYSYKHEAFVYSGFPKADPPIMRALMKSGQGSEVIELKNQERQTDEEKAVPIGKPLSQRPMGTVIK